MKKAIVHDWFTVNAGAEKCIASFINNWNDADVFSLIDFLSDQDRDEILNGKRVKTFLFKNNIYAYMIVDSSFSKLLFC